MKIDKYHLNLAGEYRVCSELLKRDIFATVSYGNMKGCDVIAVGPNRRAAVIEVKASQGLRFVTGYFQKYKTKAQIRPVFWTLYSVRRTTGSFEERFFILTDEELRRAQSKRNFGAQRLSYAECARRCAKGVDNVRVDDVAEHEDAWDKIVEWCSAKV
jgi:hypothetical protein